MRRNLSIYFFCFLGQFLSSQINNSYDINVELISENQTLIVNQKMKYTNTSGSILDRIYLEDWSNSYSDDRSKLAKRISDEYSRSFLFSKKNQRGSTNICLLYTSPSPRDAHESRMPSSA